MSSKDWYKLTFQIESNLEDNFIWQFNEIGISSFSFEHFLNNENIKKVNLWLPILDWDKRARINLELIICKLCNLEEPRNNFFEWSVIEEEDWLTSWKKYWAPQPVGHFLLILPCWLDLDEKKYKNKKVIKIDPGAAFGTGGHPSTYLCLEKMEKLNFTKKKVLDIGSGSGILSVTSRCLGAKEICAIDNDYLAINSTKSNFELNFGSLENLKTYLGNFNVVIRKYVINEFDFILCNILAEVIKEIIPDINTCLKKNGKVIFSGILNSQKDEILKILNVNHLKLIEVSSKKDWVCIEAQKANDLTYP